jgi:hypothetical protein
MRKFNAPYDNMGFDKVGNHNDTGTKYNFAGFDKEGYHQKGWNIFGNFKHTGTKFDKSGYNRKGFDKDGSRRSLGYGDEEKYCRKKSGYWTYRRKTSGYWDSNY